jgi:tRNA-specific 2-thiouridylase
MAKPCKTGSCCAGQDIDDAQAFCETLGIPHYVLDYESVSSEAVINPFAESYLAGETPIPCVACNQTVKFADLLATARDLGADALATGHYIRSRADGAHRSLNRPVDADRDQSYFLFATTQEQLDFLRFPLGELTKDEDPPELAADMGLIVADKPDSQDICFVPHGNYADVITKLAPTQRWPAISSMSTGGCSASIPASFITRSASARASAWPPAIRSTWCISTPARGG